MITIRETFDDYAKSTHVNIMAAMNKAGMAGEKKAAQDAPHKSYNLQNSIGYEADTGGVSIFAEAEYAKFQAGKPYHHPFLKNGLEAAKDAFIRGLQL